METQNLAKWISELQAQIDQVKRMAIAAAASGGDEVTITPALESGTKIADYTIGEDTSGSLYAPTPAQVTQTNLFYDTEHATPMTFVAEGQISYEATEDCAVKVNITVAPANTSVQVRIDNFVVWAIQHTTESQAQVTVYLKAGQTLTTVGIGNSQYNGYSVIPLLPPTPPTTESTRKGGKKK